MTTLAPLPPPGPRRPRVPPNRLMDAVLVVAGAALVTILAQVTIPL